VLPLRRAEAGSPGYKRHRGYPGARGFHCGQDAFQLSFGTYGKLLVLILCVW
jgi:hypothetical protein